MAEKKLGAAVVAVGEGFRHIQAYQGCKDYNLLALSDPDRERIDSRIKQYDLKDIRICSDYREILKMDDVDVVSVPAADTPPGPRW